MAPSISFENVCLDGAGSTSGRLLRRARPGRAVQIGEVCIFRIDRIALISAPATAHEQDGSTDQQPEGDDADPDGGAGAAMPAPWSDRPTGVGATTTSSARMEAPVPPAPVSESMPLAAEPSMASS